MVVAGETLEVNALVTVEAGIAKRVTQTSGVANLHRVLEFAEKGDAVKLSEPVSGGKAEGK